MKLKKIIKLAKANPGSWFHRTGILALLGAALTANFVVEYAVNSGTPIMVASALLTALFLSLVIVVWNRAGSIVLILLSALTLVGAVVTYLQAPTVLAAPRLPDPSPWLWFSLALTIFAALLTLGLWAMYKTTIYNPEITPIRNGITLIGVLASAVAFNLDPKLGPWIGWPVIVVTLFSLEPIWSSEAETDDLIAELRADIERLEKSKTITPGKVKPVLRGRKGRGKNK